MKLTLPGTRGYIEARTPRHRRHTATLEDYGDRAAMTDCGEDWYGCLHEVRPRAILITHPQPDYVFGLKDVARCPVYAIEEAWQQMADIAHHGMDLVLRQGRPSP